MVWAGTRQAPCWRRSDPSQLSLAALQSENYESLGMMWNPRWKEIPWCSKEIPWCSNDVSKAPDYDVLSLSNFRGNLGTILDLWWIRTELLIHMLNLRFRFRIKSLPYDFRWSKCSCPTFCLKLYQWTKDFDPIVLGIFDLPMNAINSNVQIDCQSLCALNITEW